MITIRGLKRYINSVEERRTKEELDSIKVFTVSKDFEARPISSMHIINNEMLIAENPETLREISNNKTLLSHIKTKRQAVDFILNHPCAK